MLDTSALDRIGSGAQSAAGPEIERLRQVEELLREVRRHNNDRANCEALL